MLVKIKIQLKSIDKLYTQDEIEIFKLPEVLLAYLNPQHHQAQKSLVLHYQTLLRSLNNKTHQISLQTI